MLAAVPTPFTDANDLDTGPFLEHCEWVIDRGCDGLNVLGTTGEANSQTGKARAQVMRAAAQSSLSRNAMMVGTGTPSLGDTIELTTLAARLGYDAALILPPYYYKQLTEDGLFDFFSAVLRSVHGDDIGIYLYNFPQMTGITFTTEFVERLLKAYPRQLQGMKDSSGDMAYTNNMAAIFAGRFDVFPGSEAPLPDAAEFGYAGCISASVNATVERAAKVWRQRDQVSDAEIAELRDLRSEIASAPMVAAVKSLVSMRTGRAEWRRVLPPLVELSGANLRTIEAVARRLELPYTPTDSE